MPYTVETITEIIFNLRKRKQTENINDESIWYNIDSFIIICIDNN